MVSIAPQLINSFGQEQFGAGANMFTNAMNREVGRYDDALRMWSERLQRQRDRQVQMEMQRRSIKAQEDAQKRAQKDSWMKMGIGTAAGAAGGAVVGGLAAAPASAIPAASASAGGVPLAAAAPAVQSATMGGVPAFANGNVFGGAAIGGALGAMDSVSGGNTLGTAINMPAQNAFNNARLENMDALTRARNADEAFGDARADYWNSRAETENDLRPGRKREVGLRGDKIKGDIDRTRRATDLLGERITTEKSKRDAKASGAQTKSGTGGASGANVRAQVQAKVKSLVAAGEDPEIIIGYVRSQPLSDKDRESIITSVESALGL